MKILIYDPFAGISGDMNLGAMADLGVPEELLADTVKALKLPGCSLKFDKVKRKGITGTLALVTAEEGSGPGPGPTGPDPGPVSGLLENPRSAQSAHTHHAYHAHHRGLDEIKKIILSSSLDEAVCRRSIRMFEALAEAEGHIHGIKPEEVHFHEVGALDSIIDITGAAAAIEYLKPDIIYSKPPELGGGFINCAHGRLPVPAPATAELLKGIPVTAGGVSYEATTPTGAVILKVNVDEFISQCSFIIKETGYGAGSRDGETPNLLRVFLAEASGLSEPGDKSRCLADESTGEAVVFNTNIDDMNPEIYEYVLSRLFSEGAKDAYLTPVYMKKNRPGTLLTVVAEPHNAEKIREIIFRETTTAGIREQRVKQFMLDRKSDTAVTEYGNIRIKKLFYKGECLSSKPEYDDVKEAARKHNLSIRSVYNRIYESKKNELKI